MPGSGWEQTVKLVQYFPYENTLLFPGNRLSATFMDIPVLSSY